MTRRRRRWKRAAPASRRRAAASLGDVFAAGRRVWSGPLGLFLLLATAIHAGAAVLVLSLVPTRVSPSDVLRKGVYLRKIVLKERGRRVVREMADRVTMPPPPADPEHFAAQAMQTSLTTDIEKVVGNLLDVSVTKRLAGKVASTLRDELAAAARDIVGGKLSEAELKQLQESFRRRAHDEALKALKDYRVETQTRRAAMETTDWYEQEVSPVLFTNVHLEMYGYNRPSNGPVLWYTTWAGGRGTPRWHDLASLDKLSRLKLRWLQELLNKVHGLEGHRAPKQVPPLQPPSPQQARHMANQLRRIYNLSRGGKRGGRIYPPWRDFIYGGKYYCGAIQEFYPHKEKEIRKVADELEVLWKQAFARADSYLRKAEAGAAAGELAAPQKGAVEAVEAILGRSKTLWPDHHVYRDCCIINHALRLEVLGDTALQKKLHKRFEDQMVETLSGLIRDYAEGQYLLGIIKHDDSVEKALAKFPHTVLPLVRRDVRKLLPFRKFQRIICYPYKHRSPITGRRCPPTERQYQADRKAMAEAIQRHPELAEYAAHRRRILRERFELAVHNVVQVIREYTFTQGLLTRRVTAIAEGVDYADEVKQKLGARQAALQGRGQDLARLTKQGLPDVSAPLVALRYLSKGAVVEPVLCARQPGYVSRWPHELALRGRAVRLPPPPSGWGRQATQPEVPCPFKDSPRFEAIPFLPKLPPLDGDLSDWGRIRPLTLIPDYDPRRQKKPEPILLYAAWNYQGFYFGYKVRQPAEDFFYPEQYRIAPEKRPGWAGGGFTGQVKAHRAEGYQWMAGGDHLLVLLDTLDARSATRGDPHTQEFVIIPAGSDVDPTAVGYECIIASKRDAQPRNWRRVKTQVKVFLPQPPADHGPDGTGPYRVAKIDDSGPPANQSYTVEVFLPRSLLNMPALAPGWCVGFDCRVAAGYQGRRSGRGQYWSPKRDALRGSVKPGLRPSTWGDLMLLGTDPHIVVQNVDESWSLTEGVVAGLSYLLTVLDPDRNIHITQKDTLLVSAEATAAGTGTARRLREAEVLILEETKPNSGVFRGFIDTQPGTGGEVMGVLELMPGDEIRLAYVDLGNARGQRNVTYQMTLPVIAPVSLVALTQGGAPADNAPAPTRPAGRR